MSRAVRLASVAWLAAAVACRVAADVVAIDLAAEQDRQVVVDREPGRYLGHPTTVLLEDGRTVLCVYPQGHGRGPICLKRSTDGGRTWSERLPVPASWATSRETPTIHRVVDAAGTKRLIVFSGLHPARMAVSDDDGRTWSELEPLGDWGGIVVMGSVVPLRTGPGGGHAGEYLAFFHDDGRYIAAGARAEKPVRFTLYATRSVDGGLTWGAPQAIQSSTDVHLCEPGVIRSPDGRRLAMLLRENSRRKNAHVMFSDDEGRTWSEPRELPRALTGDRHVGVYAPDGRLFVSFRDTAKDSPTAGDWVAWVGTWDDVVAGRDGQYRVRLMDNTKGGDCAYPGVEVLPDGTLLATTYGHWIAGEEPFIVSVRLTLEELDARTRAADGAEPPADEPLFSWQRLPDMPDPPGVGGGFCGVAGGSLIVAGGANFPDALPWEGGEKRWHDAVWALDAADASWRRLEGGLPRPLGYGVAATWGDGIACVGGSDATGHHADAFVLRRDGDRVAIDPLPPLSSPLANMAGCRDGSRLYVVGGIPTPDAIAAERRAWVLDLAEPVPAWRPLPPLPAPGRMLAACGVQAGHLVVAGGTALEDRGGAPSRLPCTTAFALDLARPDADWRRLADPPRPIIAAPGPAFPLGPAHLVFPGGDDGIRPAAGPAAHRGFPRDVLVYHTITDTWCRRGDVPAAAVTTGFVPWNGRLVIPGGEIRPGVRTTAVWAAEPVARKLAIRWPDVAAIVAYFLAVLGLGGAFSRQKDTDQFFLGGHRIPWWAAGISIYATMLSSITFMAIPAKAYATDWAYFLGTLSVVALVPVIIGVYLPFFRRVRADSAYEYLERRFNAACRCIASLSFILFQVGRMAIVTVLPALAMATVANVDVTWCVALVGMTSVAYTVVGGIEAVIWADVLQAVVLLGGALAVLVTVLLQVPGGPVGVWELAAGHGKFFADLSWSWDVALPTAWVILIGNLFTNLIPYTASQDVVQRYMTTPDAATAARAIRVNAWVTLPSSALFFAVGTALYAFYATHPARLDPTLPTDAILPLFVSRELPAGLAGLVVAGVFAAAQSTVAGSLTSVSTCWLADIEDRLFPGRDPAGRLGRARRTTAVFGILATIGAIVVARLGLASLWDGFLELLGLTGGALAGLFALGILSRRATGAGALVGAAASVAVLVGLKWGLPGRVHMLLYAAVGIVTCYGVGWMASLVVGAPPRDLTGLTLTTLGPAPPRPHEGAMT